MADLRACAQGGPQAAYGLAMTFFGDHAHLWHLAETRQIIIAGEATHALVAAAQLAGYREFHLGGETVRSAVSVSD